MSNVSPPLFHKTNGIVKKRNKLLELVVKMSKFSSNDTGELEHPWESREALEELITVSTCAEICGDVTKLAYYV